MVFFLSSVSRVPGGILANRGINHLSHGLGSRSFSNSCSIFRMPSFQKTSPPGVVPSFLGIFCGSTFCAFLLYIVLTLAKHDMSTIPTSKRRENRLVSSSESRADQGRGRKTIAPVACRAPESLPRIFRSNRFKDFAGPASNVPNRVSAVSPSLQQSTSTPVPPPSTSPLPCLAASACMSPPRRSQRLPCTCCTSPCRPAVGSCTQTAEIPPTRARPASLPRGVGADPLLSGLSSREAEPLPKKQIPSRLEYRLLRPCPHPVSPPGSSVQSFGRASPRPRHAPFGQ